MKFFTVTNDTKDKPGFPCISEFTEGFGLSYFCEREKRNLYYGTGEMVAKLYKTGTKWVDILNCGVFPFLIVSEKVIECCEKEGIGTFPIHEVKLVPPLPTKLAMKINPKYFWIDGAKLTGALIDFELSGFVDVKFCPECGTRTDDIAKTLKKQYSGDMKASYVFQEKTWNGFNLFTTDISETKFFCTEPFVECAKKYNFTNFRFSSIDEKRIQNPRWNLSKI